jgi:hypothetical protein
VAYVFIAAAESNTSSEVFNVGSGNHYSVNALVALLESEVVYIQRPGGPDCTFADISKIQEKLGWTAKVRLQEGVSYMLLAKLESIGMTLLFGTSIAHQDIATKTWFKYLREMICINPTLLHLEEFKQSTVQVQKISIKNKQIHSFELGLDLVVEKLMQIRDEKRNLYVIGNGGSAGIASHAVTDFVNVCKLKASTLHESSLLTCMANDYCAMKTPWLACWIWCLILAMYW